MYTYSSTMGDSENEMFIGVSVNQYKQSQGPCQGHVILLSDTAEKFVLKMLTKPAPPLPGCHMHCRKPSHELWGQTAYLLLFQMHQQAVMRKVQVEHILSVIQL